MFFASMARASNGKITLLAFVALVLMFINGATVSGRNTLADLEIESELNHLNKHAIKTIKTVDGDIIDCVDIYKQPAFDHPLLKNHTIQMRPSNYEDGRKPSSNLKLSGQVWGKFGSCPEGTIPIQRLQKRDLNASTNEGFGIKAGIVSKESVKLDLEEGIVGGSAAMNVWNVHVEPGEFSSASVFVGSRGDKDFVTAGWMVSRSLFGDDAARLFGFWASDNGGCFNLRCPGFIQTNKDIGFGFALTPVSVYGGVQWAIHIKIYKDKASGNWWLAYNNTPMGYWPGSLFKKMVTTATYIQWGGQVSDTSPGGKHTSTQMGSGHFPSEGKNKAAYFDEIVYFDDYGLIGRAPYKAGKRVDKPGCYDMGPLMQDINGKTGLGFYYGGPGGPNCG